MATPTAAICAASNLTAQPGSGVFRQLTLVQPDPAMAPARPGPRCFTVLISPLVHCSLPLPPGLSDIDAERYVRAYALSRGQDCCIERDGSGVVYFLSDGARFKAAR